MATWNEVGRALGLVGGVQASETAWSVQVPVRGGTHRRMVFVSYEFMQPALELVDIKSAFARTSEVEAQAILDNFGHLQAGAIGCTSVTDDAGNRVDGLISVATTIPLAVLDLTETGMFLLYLTIVGSAADHISQMISSSVQSQPT